MYRCITAESLEDMFIPVAEFPPHIHGLVDKVSPPLIAITLIVYLQLCGLLSLGLAQLNVYTIIARYHAEGLFCLLWEEMSLLPITQILPPFGYYNNCTLQLLSVHS